MQVTKEVVYQMADLAKLYLSEEECSALQNELGAVIAFADILGTVDTDEIDIAEYVGENVNVFRDDVICPSMERDIMLANAPEKQSGYFKVPKFME